MAKLLNKLANASISRRDFLKGSAVATAAIAGLSLVGCQDVKETEEQTTQGTTAEPTTGEVSPEHSAIVDIEEGGKWVSAACWHNCGGRCMNKVMVKDGAVVRQKTDDTHEDSWDYPQQRGCVRGKAQQQQCFGADRIKYPMKRKTWSPENANGKNRGIDEWERISWDEAIKYVADEFKKIKAAYGNQAFLVGSYGSMYSCPPLLAFGGHTSTTDTTSMGTYCMNAWVYGDGALGFGYANDRMDMLNADYVLMHASNPAWSAAGTPSYHFIRAKEAGVKFVSIDPMYSASAQMLDAEWVPVRTGTDTALFLGIASEMVRLDETKGDIIDWEFLNKYTVGFDAEHKPADLKEDVNFLSYLKGEYDGVAKTAEWASEICGVSVDQITMLAEVLGKKNNVWMLHNYAAARNNGAENLPQLFMTVGAMGGHMGKAGNCCTNNYHANAGNGGKSLVLGGGTGLPGLANEIQGVIPGPQVWEACKTGKYRYCGDHYGAAGSAAGVDMTCDIHCIVHDDNAYLQTGPNMKEGIEVHRAMDFVVSKAQFLTTQAKYSDIVLPVTTRWETPGSVDSSNREFLPVFAKVVDPLYEAKTDQEINSLLIEALGLDSKAVYPISETQAFFNQLAGSTVWKDGAYVPLVTITDADIAAWGVEGTAQQGIIGLQEIIDNGGYQVERKEGDEFSKEIGHAAFIADPVANPLGSASGKIEICCQAKADLLNSFGFSKRTYAAYPEYIVPELGYETTFKNGDIKGEKGKYPFLLFNPHYIRRSHTVFNNCPWLREAWPNPVYLNASDAKAKGIKNGDTVKVWTKYGEVLRKACCMEGLVPGQVGIPHGSWVNVDEKTGIDMAGADNYLLGNDIYGMGVSGYNNNNCNYEKYDGPELEDDCYTDSRIIDLD
ncbi:MAG: molybdopterin-dependent oxidoreductase [Lachnospiraceae bacterium]|nr:molybdopterin-dependent oxidoreductase [Lachnospiraceae bacterium]